MTVLFCNNYPMREARRLCEAGLYPGQHLWGTRHLEKAGYEVEIVPDQILARRPRFSRPIGGRLGNLPVEALVARHGRAGLAYAGDPGSLRGLALLRAAGCWRGPLCCVVHPQLDPGSVGRLALRGYDLTIAISRCTLRSLSELRGPERESGWLPWGPDLDYPGYVATDSQYLFCGGRVNRDTETLIAAVDIVGVPAVVHVQGPRRRPKCAKVDLIDSTLALPHADVMRQAGRASVIAIPLVDTDRLSGLSELNDALALGKPVIMTRSPYIDVDIEAVGCGIWVDKVGDARAWAEAIDRLRDANLRESMGRAGRRFAEQEWNADLFGAGLVRLMQPFLDRSHAQATGF